MYDARGRSASGGQSGVLFGLITVAVIAVAFFGVLMMPTGGKATNGPKASSPVASGLLGALDDQATYTYVSTLQRVAPEAATFLEADAEAVLAAGGDKDELAELVLESMTDYAEQNIHLFGSIDVKHVDALVSLSEAGLRDLSARGSKWCKGSHYESLSKRVASPEDVERMVRAQFTYGSEGYEWGLKVNAIVAEAISDARANPKAYGAMTAQDERAVQSLAMRLIADPQIMKLMTLQGQNKAALEREIRSLDFCRLAVTGIDAYQSLPEGTRGRLWGEAFKDAGNFGMGRMLGGMGGF